MLRLCLEKSKATKIIKHTTSGYSLFTQCSFDATKNKHDHYRGQDCMENLFRDLKNHEPKIISCERKEMIPLSNKENK